MSKQKNKKRRLKVFTPEFKAERLRQQRKYLGTSKRLLRGAKIRARQRGSRIRAALQAGHGIH